MKKLAKSYIISTTRGADMKKILLFLLSLLFIPIFLICSCAPVPPVKLDPRYTYESNGIGLNIKADPKLHFYQGYPHTIRLCLYQLIDPMEFKQLQDKKEGLEKLCEGSSFAKVTAFKCYFLNPGHELRETLDRAEGTKWVGLIACYYRLEESKVIRHYEIPIKEEKIDKKTIQMKPSKLDINLYLGPEEIQDLR